MERQEKLELVGDILEMEAEELTEDMVLEEIETWDSVAVLSVISVMNDKFDRFPLADEIRSYHTVGDLMAAMKA